MRIDVSSGEARPAVAVALCLDCGVQHRPELLDNRRLWRSAPPRAARQSPAAARRGRDALSEKGPYNASNPSAPELARRMDGCDWFWGGYSHAEIEQARTEGGVVRHGEERLRRAAAHRRQTRALRNELRNELRNDPGMNSNALRHASTDGLCAYCGL